LLGETLFTERGGKTDWGGKIRRSDRGQKDRELKSKGVGRSLQRKSERERGGGKKGDIKKKKFLDPLTVRKRKQKKP